MKISKILYLFLILGLIFGPINSIIFINQYYSNPLDANYPYYNVDNKVNFNNGTSNFYVTPSNLNAFATNYISVINNSVYSLVRSDNFPNSQLSNTSNANSFMLFETNMTSDFRSIQSTKVYTIPGLKLTNHKIEYQYSRPFYYNSSFWTLEVCMSGSPLGNPFLVSFNKEGTILSNNSLNLSNFLTSWQSYIVINPLGFYQNNFLFTLINSSGVSFDSYSNAYINPDSSYFNSSLFSLSMNSFKVNLLIPLNNLVNSSFKISLYNPVDSNIDNNYLWIQGARMTNSYNSYNIALSLTEIFTYHSSHIQELVDRKSLSNEYISNSNLIANLKFKNLQVCSLGSSDYFIHQNRAIYETYLCVLSNDTIGYVYGGIGSFSLIKYPDILTLSIISLGYMLFITESLILIYVRFFKK